MIRARGMTLLLVSAVLAGLAVLVATRWMNARAAALDASRPGVVKVAVAAIEIPFGTKIDQRHVTTIDMIAGTQPGDTYAGNESPIGKVAKSTILAGELLLKARFVDQGEGSTLAAVVSPSMRAVSIRVDDVVGVGGFLLPGNRVDVLASYERERKAFAETILSDVKVLAVDQSASADKNEPVVVRAVTLEVSPDGAEAIVRAKEIGRLQLTLRNPMDDSVAPPPKVEAKAPETVVKFVRSRPAEPAAPVVQVIRGTSVATRSGS